MTGHSKLLMSNITKAFPGVKALDEVSFEVNSGEIIGLVGVNGAGKSTLMNILGGLIHPDHGEIHIDGKKTLIHSPKAAEQHGIAFIHQELLSFMTMSVAENVFISHLHKSRLLPFLLNKRSAVREAKKYLEMLGSNVNPTKKMVDIPIGERQVVEIARSVAMGSAIVIFDEPTSSLSLVEKENLFEIIQNLKRDGKAVIYITHFLDEIMKITDRFLVLRNGKVNGQGRTDDVSKFDIIRMIIGKDIEYDSKAERKVEKKAVLKVAGINSGTGLKSVSLTLNEGEILGIWGLMGSGRTELIRALLGLDKIGSGDIFIQDKGGLKKISPKRLFHFCGYVTESRHSDGLFLRQPVWKNISATSLKSYSSRLFNVLDTKKQIEDTQSYIGLLNISAPGPRVLVESLSGGNQQKVVFSKWLNKKAKYLIMDEPTKGVDVGAKLEIHNLIKNLAEQGTSIILVSSEVEEIIILSDRVAVIKDGAIVKDLEGDEITNANLMRFSLEGEAGNA